MHTNSDVAHATPPTRWKSGVAGHLDADLQLQQSLLQPEVGGVMRFSRGVAYLNPQGPSPTGQGSAEAGAQEADLVAQAFSALQARKEGAANGLVRQHSRLETLQQVQLPFAWQPLCVLSLELCVASVHALSELGAIL